jgi:glycerol-3-phosphate dehydrogenase
MVLGDGDVIDLLVVGGGINGVGIARDAAGRGARVVLVEQDDLAGHTSSASSKLIHGGLRYLEYYEFRLVREALIEREVLLRAAPHIIWPMSFVLPHSPEQRPLWMIRLGLFLYDHLGGRKLLPGARKVNLLTSPLGIPLKSEITDGFTYADCWVEDSRLVVLNALDAAERGALILTRTRCSRARRGQDGLWEIELAASQGAPFRKIKARALVNAAGPWVSDFIEQRLNVQSDHQVRLIKGSHIVVRRLFSHDHPYLLQNADGRVVFVIPYERDYCLIGTTDIEYEGEPKDVRISADEIGYLCAVVNRHFAKPVKPEDVVWSYAGVRPLYNDASGNASAVPRDYVFDLDTEGAPLLSVFGGKITTYRKLAEHALGKLEPLLKLKQGPWTAGASLPGGDIPEADFEGFIAAAAERWSWLPPDLLRRYGRAYGTRIEQLLDGCEGMKDLGTALGDGLYEVEVDYLMRKEWAQTDQDILWRRSKLGLHVGDETVARLRAWIGRNSDDWADGQVGEERTA